MAATGVTLRLQPLDEGTEFEVVSVVSTHTPTVYNVTVAIYRPQQPKIKRTLRVDGEITMDTIKAAVQRCVRAEEQEDAEKGRIRELLGRRIKL